MGGFFFFFFLFGCVLGKGGKTNSITLTSPFLLEKKGGEERKFSYFQIIFMGRGGGGEGKERGGVFYYGLNILSVRAVRRERGGEKEEGKGNDHISFLYRIL